MSIFIKQALSKDQRSYNEVSYTSDIELKLFDEESFRIEKNRWSLFENMEYVNFLEENKYMFVNKETRRSNKVFILISERIRSRTIHQVKSHHQKMLKKHKNIQGIIGQLLKAKTMHNQKNINQTKLDSELQIQTIFNQDNNNLFNQIQLQKGISHAFSAGEVMMSSDWFLDL